MADYPNEGSVKLSPPEGAALLATALVVVGLADMPYGYYTLLRLALCGISVPTVRR